MDVFIGIMSDFLEMLYRFSETIGLPYYGVAIILFTIIIKIILFPLNWKQTVSTRRTAEVQPLVAKLQKKYAHDKQVQNAKIMELYKKKNINPYAGCLPLLVQLPILLCFFYMLRGHEYGSSGAEYFLGYNINVSPWAAGFNFSVMALALPVLSAATAYLMAKYTMPATTPAPASTETKGKAKKEAPAANPLAGQQKMMTIFMPAFMFYIAGTIPAGLGIYIVTMNVFSALQTLIVNKKLDHDKKKRIEERRRRREEAAAEAIDTENV